MPQQRAKGCAVLLRMEVESSWGRDLQGHSPSLDPNLDGSGWLGVAVEPPTTLFAAHSLSTGILWMTLKTLAEGHRRNSPGAAAFNSESSRGPQGRAVLAAL